MTNPQLEFTLIAIYASYDEISEFFEIFQKITCSFKRGLAVQSWIDIKLVYYLKKKFLSRLYGFRIKNLVI